MEYVISLKKFFLSLEKYKYIEHSIILRVLKSKST